MGRKSRESRGDGDGGWRSGRTLTATEGEAFGSIRRVSREGEGRGNGPLNWRSHTARFEGEFRDIPGFFVFCFFPSSSSSSPSSSLLFPPPTLSLFLIANASPRISSPPPPPNPPRLLTAPRGGCSGEGRGGFVGVTNPVCKPTTAAGKERVGRTRGTGSVEGFI